MQEPVTPNGSGTSEMSKSYAKLEEYRGMFKKSVNEQNSIVENHKSNILRKDKEIAALVGTEPETVCVFRNIFELYSYCEYLRVRENELVSQDKSTASALKKQDIKSLIDHEVGCVDYGIKETQSDKKSGCMVKEDIRQMNKLKEVVVVTPEKSKRQDEGHSENKGKRAKLNHNSVAKVLEKHEKMVVDNQELLLPKESVLEGPSTNDDKMQVNMHQDTVVVKSMHVLEVPAELEVNKENGRSMNSRSAEHHVNLAQSETHTIWDIPLKAYLAQVRRCLHFYGKTKFVQWKPFGKSKALEFSIKFWSEKRMREFKKAWTIHFVEGKTCRVTPGSFEREILEERASFKAVIKNVPTTAVEVLLLRQLRVVNAKAVYISHNKNQNQRRTATVYFGSHDELETALARKMYYFDVKLEWIDIWNKSNRNIVREETNSKVVEPQVVKVSMSKGRKWKRQQTEERVCTSSAAINKENSNPKFEGLTTKAKGKQAKDVNEEIKLEFQFKSIFDEILGRLDRIEKSHLGASGPNHS